jgi:hypothetical protein
MLKHVYLASSRRKDSSLGVLYAYDELCMMIWYRRVGGRWP